MAHTHTGTERAEEDLQEIKKNIEELVKRLASLKNSSGEVMSEQLDNLSEVISGLKHKGEKKSKEMLEEVSVSTQKHPLRNLAYAFGVGALLSLILSR